MPILVRGVGGGGGGYKYPLNGIKDFKIKLNGSAYYATWTDPPDIIADGKTISEWKGTLLVRNSTREPQTVDDGTVIVDSTIRDRYKTDGYDLGANAEGYFYRVFPYTKKYVVSGAGNSDYAVDPSDSNSLNNAPWSLIDYACKNGRAKDYWKVGDVKKIKIGGPLNLTVDMEIAGFNQDTTDSMNPDVITFLSKVAIGSCNAFPYTSYTDADGNTVGTHLLPKYITFRRSYLRSYIKNNIEKCLDSDLLEVAKHTTKNSMYIDNNANSSRLYNPDNTNIETTNDIVFIPSLGEVFVDKDDLKADSFYQNLSNNSGYNNMRGYLEKVVANQDVYSLFKNKDRVRRQLSGGSTTWFLRNWITTSSLGSTGVLYIDTDGSLCRSTASDYQAAGNWRIRTAAYETYTTVLFGFCV